jgi:hypothetical protein
MSEAARMKKENEFDNFDRTMRDLMSVPHDEIKAALDAEKTEKQKKKRKTKTRLSKEVKSER